MMVNQTDKRQRNTAVDRFYDRYERDPRAKAFYRSPEWLSVRVLVLERDHGLCQQCLRDAKISPADAVHHIKPLLERWDLRLDLDNLEGICDPCHNRERAGDSTAEGLMFDADGNLVKTG